MTRQVNSGCNCNLEDGELMEVEQHPEQVAEHKGQHDHHQHHLHKTFKEFLSDFSALIHSKFLELRCSHRKFATF